MSSLFEFVKAQISILDIISERVQLRQAGSYWKGSCPFHSETDASFTVSPDRQIFYCFGCHASGDAIAFIAKIENLTQIEAAKFLIEQFKISVPEDLKKSANSSSDNFAEKDAYFSMCRAVALYLHNQFLLDAFATNYLKKRGFSEGSIKTFEVGYFPGGLNRVNQMVKELSRQGVLLKDLLEYGILVEGRSFLYSPFEERIIFPIKDHLGRYCGFGGRIFKQGDERPKYYNSKESDGFVKGRLLFALDLTKKDMQEKEYAFLVEGYTDCITMFQHGYRNTVATLGTACTVEHLKLLSRFIKTLYVVYDGDKAGQNAILRLAEFCWGAKLDLKVVTLPAQHDPASLLCSGEGIDKYVEQSRDIFSFFVESLGGNFQQKPLSDKIALAEKIVAVIVKLDDEFKKDLVLAQAAMVMNIPFDSLKRLLERHKYKKFEPAWPVLEANEDEQLDLPDQDEQSEIKLLEEKIFSAIINNEGKKSEIQVDQDLRPYFSINIKNLLNKFEMSLQDCSSETEKKVFSHFIDSLDNKDRDWVIKLSMKNQDVSQESFDLLVLRFCKVNWKQIVQGIKDEMAKAKQLNDPARLSELLSKFLKLKEGIQSKGLI
ncbi:MAG: DNA primase [Candidatus Babeliales bacterium]|jgi:DNA primase